MKLVRFLIMIPALLLLTACSPEYGEQQARETQEDKPGGYGY